MATTAAIRLRAARGRTPAAFAESVLVSVAKVVTADVVAADVVAAVAAKLAAQAPQAEVLHCRCLNLCRDRLVRCVSRRLT